MNPDNTVTITFKVLPFVAPLSLFFYWLKFMVRFRLAEMPTHVEMKFHQRKTTVYIYWYKFYSI